MRTFLLIALAVMTGVGALSWWGMAHTDPAVASSQIYIHGTPVCVTQRGGEIRATVGACSLPRGGVPGADRGGLHGDALPPGHPRLDLPPGHPPVGPDDGPVIDGKRTILI